MGDFPHSPSHTTNTHTYDQLTRRLCGLLQPSSRITWSMALTMTDQRHLGIKDVNIETCDRQISPPKWSPLVCPLVLRRSFRILEKNDSSNHPGTAPTVVRTGFHIPLAPLYSITFPPWADGLDGAGYFGQPGICQPSVLAVGGGQPLGGS